MLYDKRWEKPEVKADPFSLESLIAWLERQPADGRYDWANCNGRCLVGLYVAAHGIPWKTLFDVKEDGYDILVGPDRNIAIDEPWTFGAALERARKVLSPQVSEP
jgi:hypothetical protein